MTCSLTSAKYPCDTGHNWSEEKGRCVYDRVPIACPPQTQWDGTRCKSCAGFGKVWGKGWNGKGECVCPSCYVEVGGDCRPCYKDNAKCVDGKCVDYESNSRDDDSWKNIPKEVSSGYAPSIEKIAFYKKQRQEWINEEEATSGKKVHLAFAYCYYRVSVKMYFWMTITGPSKISNGEVRDKMSTILRGLGRNCEEPPKIEHFISYWDSES